MPCFVETVWPSSLHHPRAQHKAASEISSCPQRQWVKLIQALAALIKPHEGRKRQGSASHTQAMGIVPALLLIERWVANEAGHIALSLETQRHRSTPTSHPLSPEVERENVKKIENFAWVGMNVGVGSHPSLPPSWLLLSTVRAHKGVQGSLRVAGVFAGHQGQCDTLCKLVWPSFTSVLCFSVIPLTKLRSCRCYKGLWVFDCIYRGQGDTGKAKTTPGSFKYLNTYRNSFRILEQKLHTLKEL